MHHLTVSVDWESRCGFAGSSNSGSHEMPVQGPAGLRWRGGSAEECGTSRLTLGELGGSLGCLPWGAPQSTPGQALEGEGSSPGFL